MMKLLIFLLLIGLSQAVTLENTFTITGTGTVATDCSVNNTVVDLHNVTIDGNEFLKNMKIIMNNKNQSVNIKVKLS